MAPADPILGVTSFRRREPAKVNLGVGVYTDDNGKIPLLECVKQAEELRRRPPHRGYLPIDGLAAYDIAVQGWFSATIRKRSSRCRRSAAPAG